MNIKNVVKILVLSAMSIILFNSCGDVEIEEVEAPLYSREYVETMVSGIGFGTGTMDDVITILDYIYNSEEFNEKYGETFEISSSNIRGTTDYETTFILGMKGEGIYSIHINGDVWCVTVSKSYFQNWKVIDCHLCDE